MSHQSRRPRILKEWSYRAITWDKMTENSSPQLRALHTRRWHWEFHMRLHVDGDVLLSYISVNLLVWGYFLKISLLFFFPSPTQLPRQLFFLTKYALMWYPTHKCENDLVWIGIYTAGKFHHGWMGDLVPYFFLNVLLIMTQTNFFPSIFSSLSF